MRTIKTCQKCHTELNYRENMKARVSRISSFCRQIEKKRFEPLIRKRNNHTGAIRSNLTVICPACGNEFTFDEYKFFGLLSPTVMSYLIIVLLALFLAVPIYVIIRNLF
jgi:uncharacterized CHY-type Zn-finger protein